MRRADRLFQIVQHLRGGRLLTARTLAEWLEVSDRTIYRDIADLQSTGVPIEGAAGIGYLMRSGYDLPPLMFTRDEIVALVAGIRMIRSWGGIGMSRAAAEALVKIELVLPEAEARRASNISVFSPPNDLADDVRERIDLIEAAIEARDILHLRYADGQGVHTDRRVHPLGLWFWGRVWTLVAWCELREDFRMFRVDRASVLAPIGERFAEVPARSLTECLRRIEAQYGPQR